MMFNNNDQQGSAASNFGSGLITLIIGGVVLWVGKATYEHDGELKGIQHQIEAVRNENQALRTRHDELVATLTERTRSRFTREDAEKMLWRVKDVEISQDAFEDKVYDNLGSLQLQISNLRTANRYGTGVTRISSQGREEDLSHVFSDMECEVSRLRADINRLHRMVGHHRATTGHSTAIGPNPVRLSEPPQLRR